MSDTQVAPEKPVYRTGSSVGAILESNAAAEVVPNAPETTVAAPATPTPNTSVELTPTATTAEVSAPVVESPKEENISSFSMQEFEEPAQSQQPEVKPVQKNIKEVLNGISPDEVLKELGVSEFAIEMDKHIKNGGKAADYVNAKGIDYNQYSDESLIKADLKKHNPELSQRQIDLIYNKRFGVSEDAMDEDKELAEAQIKSEGYRIRQERIAEQQKFQIKEVDTSSNQNESIQKYFAEEEKKIEQERQWFLSHEATKSLNESKRVAINLGDNGVFNFQVDKPELITKAITHGENWHRLTLNKQGEPDVAKMQKLVLYASNPQQFETDLVNYGKTLGRKELIEEGRNAQITAKVIPVESAKKGADWTTARTGTVGGVKS